MANAAKAKDQSQGHMVLLNSKGETVRSFHLDLEDSRSSDASTKITVIYRHDTHRIEPALQTDDLQSEGILFDVIGETSTKEIKLRPFLVGRVGSLAWADNSVEATLPPSFDLQKEDDRRDLVLAGKWIAGVQVALLMLIMVLGHFLAKNDEKEEVVTTIRTIELPKESPVMARPTVTPPKAVAKARPVVQKRQVVQKPKPQPRIVTKNAPKTNNRRVVTAQIPKTAPKVESMGALGALGGMTKKMQTGGGLNLSGASFARGADKGSGGGGAGRAGSGGVSGALFGKGLIAASNGSGARAGSAGGYGTKGKGGGRQGYGLHNLAGASGGYVAPLSSDSFVEGGLTHDQVKEVIERNMGQIRYCYEKSLQLEPNLRGRVAVNFVIAGSGRVSTARVQHSSVDSSKLEGCVVSKLKDFKFPQPVAGVNVQVQYPFSFQRGLAAK